MRSALLLILALCGCAEFEETVGEDAPVGVEWRLETVNGVPAGAPTTIVFLSNGRIRGRLPCTSYSARQTAPLPFFEVGTLETTGDPDCPAKAAEQRLRTLMEDMDLAEVEEGRLTLSGPAGNSLGFVRPAGAGV